MAILVNNKTKAIVQGITGTQGSFHTKLMLEYGTKIVAGVTPGKGGQEVHGVPVYDTVKEALSEHDANASIIFVPAPFAKDAVLEGINAGLELIVVITEHIPIKDTIQMVEVAKRNNVNIVGPNTPGVITPGECKLGIMPGHIFKRGPIGIISRSGTLTYEIASNLT
ncbi:MAG: succinate--CoA ligase subunit alpha, partial [Thermofilum sp. ex4484_82]